MNQKIGKAVMVLMFLVGCGEPALQMAPGGSGAATPASPRAADPTGSDPTAVAPTGPVFEEAPPQIGTTPQGLEVEVRMRGIGAEAYASLVLVPNQVEAFADGVRLPVKMAWNDVSLTDETHAERVATLVVPDGAQRVAFRVELGAAGGFETAGATGWVDTRQTVFQFERSLSDLLRNHQRTVIEIDAATSFVERDATTRVLVPNFRVY